MVFEFDGTYNYCGSIDNEMFAYCRTHDIYIAMHKWVDPDRGLHFKTYKKCDTHFQAIRWLEERAEL